eukprot:5820961-Pyramimonas_sp.AAC.1
MMPPPRPPSTVPLSLSLLLSNPLPGEGGDGVEWRREGGGSVDGSHGGDSVGGDIIFPPSLYLAPP